MLNNMYIYNKLYNIYINKDILSKDDLLNNLVKIKKIIPDNIRLMIIYDNYIRLIYKGKHNEGMYLLSIDRLKNEYKKNPSNFQILLELCKKLIELNKMYEAYILINKILTSNFIEKKYASFYFKKYFLYY